MGGEHTFDDIDRAAATLEAMVTGVDVALLTGPGATRLVTRLVTVERVLASCRSRAMRRAAEANQWRQAGERSPAAWAAKVLGTTTGHAAAELETAALLDALPATRTARDTGSISGLQAREIAGAATADVVPPAARPRSPEGKGQAVLHGARLRRHPPPGVPLRSPLPRAPRRDPA